MKTSSPWAAPHLPYVRLGSKGEILAASRCFPLWPQQRTSLNRVGMSVRCQKPKSVGWHCLSNELSQQRLGLFQIERAEALGKPIIDRREQVARLVPIPLLAKKPRHAHC